MKSNLPNEIERKFLISQLPNLPEIKSVEIHQAYLNTQGHEVRIRKSICEITDYKMAVKSEGDICRTEIEFLIDETTYEQLLTLIGHPPIVKHYHIYRLGEYELEASIVNPHLSSTFCYAEIEFQSEEEAKAFDCAQVLNLIKEVTYDESYKMRNYWNQFCK